MDCSLFIFEELQRIIKIEKGEFIMVRYKKICILILVVVLVMGSIAGCSESQATKADNEESLLVYCGAGLRKPMDEIGQMFKEKYGVEIQYSYAGSAQNLSQIELSGEGDVYVPGALYYYNAAKEKDLVITQQSVAYHIPVIAVPKGNPANIQTLEDLTKPEVKVILGDPKSAAIGKITKKLLEENELYEGVENNTIALTATVNELVVYITMGQCDAAIIWEDNVKGIEEVEIIQIPKEINMIKTIPVCTLKSSDKKEIAQKFVDFIVSDEGKEIFEKHGFESIK
jgi:molybdate transport system substrate-binding protein